jgi:hypothetical protein
VSLKGRGAARRAKAEQAFASRLARVQAETRRPLVDQIQRLKAATERFQKPDGEREAHLGEHPEREIWLVPLYREHRFSLLELGANPRAEDMARIARFRAIEMVHVVEGTRVRWWAGDFDGMHR